MTTQNELAFWRDAVIAALHAPDTVYDVGLRVSAVERANEALEAYRKMKAEAEAYNKSFAIPYNKSIAIPPEGG